ncbi:hypothetical protein [Flectobacillus longus]|uniref:hypothetical protein n=1 Tax=Flectobacillus longus TaxID=2984207 RepID=UPI0024B67E8C|nr:hypothetical protein [Flectobacillus longus]MDI9882691.1 hypothetical protein [Flectobacillus longus]
MFPLKNIREHVTKQLETDIKVFYKFIDSSGVIRIEESESNTKRTKQDQDLVLVRLNNIPHKEVWVYENEFYQNKNTNSTLNEQKGAFSSAGSKVEKTVLWHHQNKLYLFLVEMKRTMTYDNFVKIKEKIENSLSTLSIFIAAHDTLPSFLASEIVPVALFCFNEENFDNGYSDRSEPRKLLKTKYVEGDQTQFLMKVEPLTLNRLMIPVLLFANPNTPITNSFEIDFQNILGRVNQLI